MLLVRLLFQPAHSAVQVSANAGLAQQIQYYACPDHERSRPGEARTEPNVAQNTQPAAKHQKKHPSTTPMQEGTQREKKEKEKRERKKNLNIMSVSYCRRRVMMMMCLLVHVHLFYAFRTRSFLRLCVYGGNSQPHAHNDFGLELSNVGLACSATGLPTRLKGFGHLFYGKFDEELVCMRRINNENQQK